MKLRISTSIGLIFILISCQEDVNSPKPLGYFRIEFPEKEYQHYEGNCPFEFSYPVQSILDTQKRENREPCWMNLHYPQYAATIHLTYNQLNDTNLATYLEDSRKLAMKHTVRADNIEERVFENPEEHVYGIAYDFEGNTASNFQFIITDSTRHFMRGSMYFNLPPNSDSLLPIASFIKKDLIVLMESFRWR
ncbi:MAG: gliding motility lipoprotein GldD [Flavobacteriales bacterium]|nr:gliding motility lipoprotein GldD [Flavobacteriales bacterium]